jgi:hypothetical protein
MNEESKLRAEVVVFGKDKSPIIKIDFTPTAKRCYSGVGKFEMNGRKFFLKVVLMPENIGRIFETENQ